MQQSLTEDEVDHGWPPSHVAKLLGMIGDAQAVPVLLRCVERYEVLDTYHEDAVDALVALGEIAIDACLEAYPNASKEELREGFAAVLHRCGTKDERIYETLLDFFGQSPELGAMYLAEYGDPRAIPALAQMFDDLPVDDQDDSVMGNHVFVELQAAIEDLGGELTAIQQAKADRADAPRRSFAAQMEEAVTRIAAHQRHLEQAASSPSSGTGTIVQKKHKLGRNERCWCGSGKKYKKCHLDQDR